MSRIKRRNGVKKKGSKNISNKTLAMTRLGGTDTREEKKKKEVILTFSVSKGLLISYSQDGGKGEGRFQVSFAMEKE